MHFCNSCLCWLPGLLFNLSFYLCVSCLPPLSSVSCIPSYVSLSSFPLSIPPFPLSFSLCARCLLTPTIWALTGLDKTCISANSFRRDEKKVWDQMRKAEPREKDLHHGQHHGQRRLEELLGVMRLSIRYTIACLCFSLFCSFLASANVQGVAFFLQGRQKFELIRAELAVGKLQLFPVPPPQHTHTHTH